MKQLSDSLNQIFDNLIIDVNYTFKQFLAAYTMHNLGKGFISTIDDQVVVTELVSKNTELEPLPIAEIKLFSSNYPYFLLEVFHGKLVQIFNDCINSLFLIFVDLHSKNYRSFKELKKKSLKFDFSSDVSFTEQMKIALVSDFEFMEFSERLKLIDGILNPSKEATEDLRNIKKNILIRNAVQHKKNVIDSYFLKKLGCTEIQVLDTNGEAITCTENSHIKLTIPELNSFKASIFRIGQIWRSYNG